MGACHMWWQPVCAILPWHAFWHGPSMPYVCILTGICFLDSVRKFTQGGGDLSPPKVGAVWKRGSGAPRRIFLTQTTCLKNFWALAIPPPPPRCTPQEDQRVVGITVTDIRYRK